MRLQHSLPLAVAVLVACSHDGTGSGIDRLGGTKDSGLGGAGGSAGATDVVPRGFRAPARDVPGDRLEEIVLRVREEFLRDPIAHLKQEVVTEIAWLKLTGRHGPAQSLYSREAGNWIHEQALFEARLDPVTQRVVNTMYERPGPDARRSPQSKIRYEITTVDQVHGHTIRAGINGTSGPVRIIPYPSVRLP